MCIHNAGALFKSHLQYAWKKQFTVNRLIDCRMPIDYNLVYVSEALDWHEARAYCVNTLGGDFI